MNDLQSRQCASETKKCMSGSGIGCSSARVVIEFVNFADESSGRDSNRGVAIVIIDYLARGSVDNTLWE